MVEGKVAPLEMPNSHKLRYDPDINTVEDCIRKLSQDRAVLNAFKCVPTGYGPREKRNRVFGIILQYSDYYREGNIDKADLKELVWNYKM